MTLYSKNIMKCIYCGIHKQNCCVSTSRSQWPTAEYLTQAHVRISQCRATYLLPARCSQWILSFQISNRCDCQIHAEQDTKLFFFLHILDDIVLLVDLERRTADNICLPSVCKVICDSYWQLRATVCSNFYLNDIFSI